MIKCAGECLDEYFVSTGQLIENTNYINACRTQARIKLDMSYENRRRQNDIPLFSTERAKQENESINQYMADVDFDEKAFDMIGPNAPQEVKDAWMEAAKEVNANGMGIKKNGMLSHISQMMVQRLNKQMKGEGDVDNIDILGNTIESAIQATSQALYDLDHPREYVPKSIEVQQACMKEREFYVAFLEKLEKLKVKI